MKDNPLALICIFFCLGIWTAKYVHIPLFFVFAACLLFLISALINLKKNLFFSICLAAFIFLAGIIHLENAKIYPPDHISNFISDNPRSVHIRGKVVSNPEVSHTFYHTRKTTFTFRTSDLKIEQGWRKVQGLIKVTLYGEKEVQFGEELMLQGSLEHPAGLRNPGGFDYRAYLVNHNIFGILKVKEGDTFPIELGNGPRTKWETFLRGMVGFKQKLHRIIYRYLKPEQARLLSAILLGERAALSQDVKDLFINTGTIHILAISGLHIGLIAFILVIFFRFLRLPRRLTFTFTIILLIVYAVISGGRASVVRATIMAVIVLFGFIINREPKIYNSLGLAALIILISNPRYLFDAGFQLSFLSIISIVYFAPRIEKLFPAPNRYLFYLTRAFSVSAAAWIGIAPVAAFYFNIVTPIAILSNLVVIPLLFLVVSAGICFLFFTWLWAPLGAILAETSWLTLVGLTKTVEFISKIPLGSFHLARPGPLFFFGYWGLLLLLFNYKKLKISAGKVAIIFALAANVLVFRPLFSHSGDKLTVTFLDVGRGDAIFIEFPYSGGTMLIDGGPAGESDAGRWAVLPFLWSKGIKKIDALVLTHPDEDHVGGLASVLKNIKVDYVFDNGMSKEAISYDDYKKAVVQKVPHYRVIKGAQEICGFTQGKLFVIHPIKPHLTDARTDTNNDSLVLKLVYKDVSFIFCADIQRQAIKRILAYAPMLKSTVIKVPHHGSDEGKAEEDLFKAISAQLAIISVDRNNRFGLPAPQVLERLEAQGAKVYKTGDSGAVIISTDGKKIRVETMVGAEAGT